MNEGLYIELPPAPKDTEKWLRKEVFKSRYIIFDAKTRIGKCTLCGDTRVVLEEAKHNYNSWCPSCKSSGLYKDQRYGRKCLLEKARVLIFGSKGKDVYAGLSQVMLDYQNRDFLTGLPTIFRDLEAVYKFNKQEQLNAIYVEGWLSGGRWESRKTIKIPFRSGYWSNSYADTFFYTDNLKKVFAGTDLKYCNLEEQSAGHSAEYFIRLVDLNARFESMEMLYKVGLKKLVNNKTQDFAHSRAVNWKAKDLRKILGLNMAEIREAVRLNVNLSTLDLYKSCHRKGVNISMVSSEKLSDRCGVETILKAAGTRNVEKMLKYFETQDCYNILGDYSDYISECQKLGFDMTDSRIVYPKNLKSAHERTTSMIRILATKEQSKAIVLRAKAFEKFCYEKDGLFIRPAKNATEIIREGQSQKHCVGSYVERVAKGNSLIMLVREFSNPGKSFYTLEYHNGKILQCRGKLNCAATTEVKAFIEEWLEWTKKPANSRKKVISNDLSVAV